MQAPWSSLQSLQAPMNPYDQFLSISFLYLFGWLGMGELDDMTQVEVRGQVAGFSALRD